MHYIVVQTASLLNAINLDAAKREVGIRHIEDVGKVAIISRCDENIAKSVVTR